MATRLLLVLIALFWAAALSPARAEEPDARIKPLIEKTGFRHEVDESGYFRVYVPVEGGRSQVVYVMSSTDDFQGTEVRRLWSPGYASNNKNLPKDLANYLLENTERKILGGWEAVDTDDGVLVVFMLKIEAVPTLEHLKVYLEAAAKVADDLEKEYMKTDKW